MIFPSDPSIVKLSGRVMPGTVIAIADAKRKFNWQVSAATSMTGAATIYRGQAITEGFSVTTECVDEDEVAAVESWRRYTVPPKPGARPPTFSIENYLINFNAITRCSISEIAQPNVTETNSGIYVFTFLEYFPLAPVAAGKADPANPAGAKADPELAKLQAQVSALSKQATAVTK